ncbi:MAG: VanW family protein [Oscillospiraceae bacterium]|nr:VanW family protein [Oscillospiraceae bacterium]
MNTKARVKPKSKKKKIIFVITIILLSLALLSTGAMAAVGFSVSNGATIFPNVVIVGVPVGGLTIDEAADLLEEPMQEAGAQRMVTISFPGGNTLEVSAKEAGLSFTGYEAARIAYQYGRSDNLFSNAWSFLRGQFVSANPDPFSMHPANLELLQTAIADAADEIDLRSHSSHEIVGDELIITTGQQAVEFDEGQLIDIITDAFLAGTDTPIHYEGAAVTDPTPVNVQAIYTELFAEPKNATFDIEAEAATEHVLGISFDTVLVEALLANAQPGEEVRVPLTLIEPEITTEYLNAVVFQDVLATSTTNLTGDENRNTNIYLAASKINGLILNPGDQFDFNTVVGQRTEERGFRPGGAISGNRMVTAIGGGICQVSSTIYHALLHTELQVDARRNHTLPVAYLPMGMDAAVAWNALDFSFTNNFDFPIRIVSYRYGLTMNVRIEGTDRSPYARIEPEMVHIGTVAFTTTYTDDPSRPAGTTAVTAPGRQGHVVEIFQRFYDEDGNLVRRELVSRDNFHAVPQEVSRGTGAVAAPPPAEYAPPAEPDAYPEGY